MIKEQILLRGCHTSSDICDLQLQRDEHDQDIVDGFEVLEHIGIHHLLTYRVNTKMAKVTLEVTNWWLGTCLMQSTFGM